MKSLLRPLLALVVLAAVVGVLYWPHKTPAVAAAKPLVNLPADQVTTLQITQPGQPAVEIAKSGADWTMSQPYAFAADGPSVLAVVNALGDITGASQVNAGGDPAAFGLDKPSVVEVGLSSGKHVAFEFGSDTPTGGNAYLRLGDSGPVQMVPSDVKENALKSAFLLQDKSVVHFPSGQLTALDVMANGKKAHFVKDKDAWPKDQQSNIQSLLDALQDGQMTALPDPTGKDAAAEGMAKPTATVALTWSGGSATLALGAKKGAAEYFARNSSSPAIFTLSDYLLGDITALTSPSHPLSVAPAKK